MEPSGYFVANTVAVYTVTAFDAGLHFRVKAMASVRGDAIESCCCAQIEHALVTHAHTHTRHVRDADMALHTVLQQDTTFHILNNSVENEPILMIFGTYNPEDI